MTGKVLGWLKKRPTFFMQKSLMTRWPDQLTRDIGSSAKPMSLLSGPEHPILPQGFLTRFRGQGKGFFGMSILEVDGLLSGIGKRRRRKKTTETIDRSGIPMKIIG